MKGQYFSSSLKAEKYTIRWDKNGTISDDSCFRIFASHNEILIRPDAMVRPRIQLISVIFHILIHIYLKASSKGSIQMNAHDENFRKIMLFLNNTLKTQIKVSCAQFSAGSVTKDFLFRHSTSTSILWMKMCPSMQLAGIDAPESAKPTSHSTEPCAAHRFPTSHTSSSRPTRRLAAASSSKSSRWRVTTTRQV